MFKKNISQSSSSLLSGKDVKRLKATIEKAYAVSEEDMKLLFPAKAEVAAVKLSNRTTAYVISAINPLFFDPDGRGDMVLPTVYALWLLPRLMPRLTTWSEVSPKVLGGADLFLQGVVLPQGGIASSSGAGGGSGNGGAAAGGGGAGAALQPWAEGDARCLAAVGNEFPFAVGLMQCGSAAAVRSGMKGKGMKLVHVFGDQLYQLGDKSRPDPGFTLERIFPQQGSTEAASAAVPSADALANELAASSLGGPPGSAAAAGSPEAVANDGPPAATAEGGDAGGSSGGGGGNGSGLSDDQLIEHCLLAGLHAVPDKALPMLASDFYSKHMLPNRPAGTSVDIKKTSYKKLSKLLQAFEKKGLIKQKVVHKQDNLSFVQRGHELYQGFSPSAVQGEGGMTAAEQEAANAAPGSSGKVTIDYNYRVPASLRPVFVDPGRVSSSKELMLTEEQVAEALHSYAVAHGLLPQGAGGGGGGAVVPPSGGRVLGGPSSGPCMVLDKLLVGHLYNKKEPRMLDDVVPVSEVMERLLSKLTMHHRVSRPTETGVVEVLKKGAIKAIRISTEERQGGRKHITHVVGVESFALDPEELGGVLQRRFAAACSVTKLPGKQETGKDLGVQGSLAKEISAFLQAEYGIDAAHVEVVKKPGQK